MNQENLRYNRQIRVPQVNAQGQQKLEQARVMLVGCGALGTYAAEQLVRTGVKHLVLIDFDRVELSNLQRQSLYTEADVKAKRPKVLAAKEALLKIDETADITAIQESFDRALFSRFNDDEINLVLDCTDNFLVRELINDYCLEKKLPFIFASAAGISGQVMAFHPSLPDAPCLSCLFPNLDQLEENCETLGVITPLIPMISSLQVSLAMQVLLDSSTIDWGRMLVLDSWKLNLQEFKVKKRTSCPICGTASKKSTANLEKVCGGAYKISLPDLKTEQILAFCENEHWSHEQNSLVLSAKNKREQALSFFKNGRLLFYNFNEKAEASKVLEQIKNYD